MTEPGKWSAGKQNRTATARMFIALAAVLFVGFVSRSLATLTPPLAVGDDGAFYLVQVRAILRSDCFDCAEDYARRLPVLLSGRAPVFTAVLAQPAYGGPLRCGEHEASAYLSPCLQSLRIGCAVR